MSMPEEAGGVRNREQYAETVLEQNIPWHTHYRGDGLQLVRQYDEAGPEDRIALMRSDKGQAIVREFVYGLSSIKDRIVVQYILTLLHVALTADPSIAGRFWKLYVMSTEIQQQDNAEEPRIAEEPNPEQNSPIAGPFKPLMQMVLDDMNQYNVETAASCLIILFGALQDEVKVEEADDLEELLHFSAYMVNRLKKAASGLSHFRPPLANVPGQQAADEPVSLLPSPRTPTSPTTPTPTANNGGEVSPALLRILEELKIYLKSPLTHQSFTQLGGLTLLLDVLSPNLQTQTQLLYLVGFCLWLLSYNERMHPLLREQRLLPRMHALLLFVKEKVVRIFFCILRNLCRSDNLTEEMVGVGLLTLIPTLQGRTWKDKDLIEDFKTIEATLQEVLDRLSSFDLYQAEVSSGALRWSPVHTEKFWREHARHFENDNFQLLKQLVDFLNSDDPETLEVAAYDIGQFAVWYPDGRRIVRRFNAKDKLMMMMSDPNEKVAKQALLSVQKLLITNWKSLGSVASEQS